MLNATVLNDGVSAEVNFTFSIPKYAVKVLDHGTELEKQLVKDILSYIRAAYTYFEPSSTEAISAINAIIGADYDATSPYVAEGSTDAPTCFKSATFAITSTPAIKFYLNGDVNPKLYSFKVGGKTARHTIGSDDDGQYVKIDVYAYAMCETIECYYGGEKVGSYHIASYHEWAKTQNDSTLLTLVERFWKYCQSARDYKESIDA